MIEDCAYKTLSNMYESRNKEQPNYLQVLQCLDCSGIKSCKITLDELIQLRENYFEELNLS